MNEVPSITSTYNQRIHLQRQWLRLLQRCYLIGFIKFLVKLLQFYILCAYSDINIINNTKYEGFRVSIIGYFVFKTPARPVKGKHVRHLGSSTQICSHFYLNTCSAYVDANMLNIFLWTHVQHISMKICSTDRRNIWWKYVEHMLTKCGIKHLLNIFSAHAHVVIKTYSPKIIWAHAQHNLCC